MSSIDFSIRSNIKEIQNKLSAFAYKQLPFATATALTAMAKAVQAEEVKNLKATFKNPSPFTLKSVRMTAARKDNLLATVFVMGKAAEYLSPYEKGGVHKLNGNALLNPKNVDLNQYGNIPRRKLAQLKGRSDVFIGTVNFKSGQSVSGVWQRPKYGIQRAGGRGTKGKLAKVDGRLTGLKLLIRFGNAIEVTKKLGYRDRAKRIIAANLNKELGKALAKAMATAKA